ncbi:uncharacterized protein BKCO1_4000234 [Diplodia corticola]|uniref:DUF6536 domain-containing protein n=1 Tax=Diplodia corticola TaxID=236234 RepID=A0A1J9RAE5_9PEZI|nr:uncharacterized protein BKCO1_4000234 [Diplodia corticola]OJD38566.1 hypothetical protein BKCO1_4000234 [Diplodia corticola]
MRNLRKIQRRKLYIWIILSLSSVPFHLLYNSVFYTSTVTYAYDIYIANEGFANGAPFDEDLFPSPPPEFDLPTNNATIRWPDGTVNETWNYIHYSTSPHDVRKLAAKGLSDQFERLDKDECMKHYANAILTGRRNLILVASNSPLDNLTFTGGIEYDLLTAGNYTSMSVSWSDVLHSPDVACGPPDSSQAILTQSLRFVSCRSNSSLYAVIPWERPLADNREVDYFQWICYQGGSDPSHWITGSSDCAAKAAWKDYLGERTWTVAGFEINHCLSERMPGECSLNVALPLLLSVMCSNVVKLIAIVAAALTIKENPLMTIGDAVASFVRERDETTSGMCNWSWKDVAQREKERSPKVDGSAYGAEIAGISMEQLTRRDESSEINGYLPVQSARPFSASKQRLYEASSKGRWKVSGFMLATAFSAISGLFYYSMFEFHRSGKARWIWEMGIGAVLPETLISGWNVATSGDQAIVQTVLIANLPQLLLSFLYFTMNSLVTNMSLASEWARFGQRRCGLRVSARRSIEQKSTYFLQLPYRLGVPLLCLSVSLHWMVSQSLFFVQIKGKNAVGAWFRLNNLTEADEIITCGYSPLGMLITLVILAILAGFALIIGSRRLEPGIPMAGSCSMAISAACHVPEGTSELSPVKWGVILDEQAGIREEHGHCSFSNGEVGSPIVGRMYA